MINNGGLVPFDGDGMREYLVDEYVRASSDPPLVDGLRAGSLLEVPRGEVGMIQTTMTHRSFSLFVFIVFWNVLRSDFT